MLKQFVALSEEIQESQENISYLYLEVQIWLEDLYDAMRTSEIAFLETSGYELEILEKSYKNGSLENYRVLFEIIRNDLKKQTDSEEDLCDFLECMDFLEAQAFRFY